MFLSGRDEFDASEHAARLKFFFAFQFAGGAGFVLVILTALVSRHVKRDPTWLNFCFTWVISVISYLLLSFAHRQTGNQPEHGLCLAQASLIYSAPVLTGVATLSLVLQLWYTLRASSPGDDSPAKHRLRTVLLIGAPYVSWIGMTLVALGLGLAQPATVGRNDVDESIYCAIGTGTPGKISASLVAATMLGALVLQVLIARTLYLKYKSVRSSLPPGSSSGLVSGSRSPLGDTVSQRAVALGLMMRVAAFWVFSLLTFIVALVFYAEPGYGLINTFLSLAPLVAFLSLGTQLDILRAWRFWLWFRRSHVDELVEAEGDGMKGKPSFFLH